MKDYFVISYGSGDDDHIIEMFTVSAKDEEHARAKAREAIPYACWFNVSLEDEEDEL